MFSLNRETEYGLGFLKALSGLEVGEFLSLRKFAKANGYSLLLMQKVARALRQNHLIASEKGSLGGYFLIENPKDISVKDIIEIFEGECGVAPCFKGKKCSMSKACRQRKGLGYLDKSIMEILEKTKIVDL